MADIKQRKIEGEYTNTQKEETLKNCHPHQQYSTFLSCQHLSTVLCNWEISDMNLQHRNWLYSHSACLSLISKDKCQDNRCICYNQDNTFFQIPIQISCQSPDLVQHYAAYALESVISHTKFIFKTAAF
jgi:hypothetical protein